MDYVVAVKYGVPEGRVDLTKALTGLRGVTVKGANPKRAQVVVDSDKAVELLRSAVGDECHVEEIKPRKTN